MLWLASRGRCLGLEESIRSMALSAAERYLSQVVFMPFSRDHVSHLTLELLRPKRRLMVTFIIILKNLTWPKSPQTDRYGTRPKFDGKFGLVLETEPALR